MKIINATEDDIAGIALSIVDKMVAEGLIPNCTDTNDESEFEAQDIIREKLNSLTTTNHAHYENNKRRVSI